MGIERDETLATLEYPISHYVVSEKNQFSLLSFDFPEKDELVSNIESNELLHNAFHLIPGKKLSFDVINNGQSGKVEWDVQTDSFNNTFIRCNQSGSTAWFTNDGNLLYFTHYEGDKDALLYYFFLALFKLQQGYYQDMVLADGGGDSRTFPLYFPVRRPLVLSLPHAVLYLVWRWFPRSVHSVA